MRTLEEEVRSYIEPRHYYEFDPNNRGFADDLLATHFTKTESKTGHTGAAMQPRKPFKRRLSELLEEVLGDSRRALSQRKIVVHNTKDGQNIHFTWAAPMHTYMQATRVRVPERERERATK